MTSFFSCRENCGACCIAPSISTPLPNMPNGKPAGVKCFHLDDNYRCKLFKQSSRPAVCSGLKPCYEMCGDDRESAFYYLQILEELTKP